MTITPRILRPETQAPFTTEPRYTIATLVSNRTHYDAMLASFRAGGFEDSDCQYLFIDNTGPLQSDAYSGLNAALNAARAPIVILCHQDVRLIDDDRKVLERRLTELAQIDSHWALAGNAGGVAPGKLALRITDPHGKDQRVGTFPAKVTSLDENFLIVRRDARVGFSHDLTGFHFYGADICLHAAQMGYSAYVIDFHLQHLSPGNNKDRSFAEAEVQFRSKWSRAFTPRWIQTTCALVHLSGGMTSGLLGRVIDEPFSKIARKLPHARGWTKPGNKPA
jgi:hypothetical protein